MRILGALTLFLLTCCAISQTSTPRSLFVTVKPQATVTVQKHELGADIVEVSVLDSRYPPELLRSQMDNLERFIGSKPRGLRVFRQGIGSNSSNDSLLKASFAVDGVIDKQNGIVRVGPFVKAFAGATEPYAISGLAVIFVGIQPTAKTLNKFESASVRVERHPEAGPLGTEYRVQILKQDPEAIDIPDTSDPQAATKSQTKTLVASSDWQIWALIVVAGIAAGALVYSLLLRRPVRRG